MNAPLREVTLLAAYPAADLVSAEIERSLLAALLIKNNLYEQVVEIIRQDDFAIPLHGRIYGAIGAFIDRGERVDAVVLRPMFDQDSALVSKDAGTYLGGIVASAVSLVNAPYYAKQIRELAQRRSFIAACREAIEDAERIDVDRPIRDTLQSFDKRIIGIEDGAMESAPTPIAAAVDAALISAERTYKNAGRITGITTGL